MRRLVKGGSVAVLVLLSLAALASCLPEATGRAAALLSTSTAVPRLTPSPTHTATATTTASPEPTMTPTWPPTASPTSSATPTVTSTPTEAPRPTDTPTRTPSRTPTPAPTPVSATVLLRPMTHQWQNTGNNCGPTSIAIVLSYYGHRVTQEKVNERVPAGSLTPCDVVTYVQKYGLMARLYFSPPANEPVRQLLDLGISVISNQWYSSDTGYRHYRVIRGYDDKTRTFITADPLLGPYHRIDYDVFATLSDPGNYIAVYPPEKDESVRSLMQRLGIGDESCTE